MKKVFTAENLQQAQLILGFLSAEGVEVRLLNESAGGALGELPFTHVYPELWVIDDVMENRALTLISNYEARISEASDALLAGQSVAVCETCGEEVPPNFEICWRCGSEQ